jgi:tetratricopeptide (TPR) repeat protein
VAAGVAGRLSPQERRALGGRVTASSAAYAHFLRGNVLMARRSVASLRGAIDAYRAATAADSGFADAYARLGYAFALCAQWGCGDRDSLLADSRLATARALRFDPRSSDAWMGRAYARYVWAVFTEGADGDDSVLASLPAFRRAVELNPRNDEAWHQYGSTLIDVNDSASLGALRRALALDPGRAITYAGALSVLYAEMGRPDLALQAVDSALTLEPDGNFRGFRMNWRLAVGDTAGALDDARAFGATDVLAAFAHDSAAIRLMESSVAHPQWCAEDAAYLVWTGRREQAVQRLLGCRPSLLIRSYLRSPQLASLAAEPRIRALRAACDSILARARWR